MIEYCITIDYYDIILTIDVYIYPSMYTPMYPLYNVNGKNVSFTQHGVWSSVQAYTCYYSIVYYSNTYTIVYVATTKSRN